MEDISKICQFGWYKLVYFRQNIARFPYQMEELGRCLGPTKNEGNEMCQWILQQNGQIAPRQTLRRLIPEERSAKNEAKASKRASFDASIKEYLGDSINPAPLKLTQVSMDPTNNFDYDEFDDNGYKNIDPEADSVDSRGKSINQQSVADF